MLGKHFITYAFAQQWFKIGGNATIATGSSGTFDFTYLFANGWTMEPSRSFRWIGRRTEVSEGRSGSGRRWAEVCKCGGLPTLSQLQVQSYPIRPIWAVKVEYPAASESDNPCP